MRHEAKKAKFDALVASDISTRCLHQLPWRHVQTSIVTLIGEGYLSIMSSLVMVEHDSHVGDPESMLGVVAPCHSIPCIISKQPSPSHISGPYPPGLPPPLPQAPPAASSCASAANSGTHQKACFHRIECTPLIKFSHHLGLGDAGERVAQCRRLLESYRPPDSARLQAQKLPSHHRQHPMQIRLHSRVTIGV